MNIKAAKGESLDEKDDWQKKLTLLKNQKGKKEDLNTKSLDTVLNIIHISALPLIEKVMDILSAYDEVFAEKRLVFSGSGSSTIVQNKEQMLKLITEDSDNYMNSIKFKYKLNGYKLDRTNTFYVAVEFYWQFDQFKYYFFLNHNDHQKADVRLYDQPFSPEEIDLLANQCGKKMMDKIEEKSSQ